MQLELRNRKIILFFSSLSHLIVDMSTIFLTLNCIGKTDNMLLYIMLYNFFAFTLQLPIGLVVDKTKNTYVLVLISFFCILFGTFI